MKFTEFTCTVIEVFNFVDFVDKFIDFVAVSIVFICRDHIGCECFLTAC